MANFRIEQGKYGKRIVPMSKWTKDLTDYCLANDIKDIYLNIAFGWSDHDFSFLKDLKGLEALKILAGVRDDISPIHHLREVKSLSLDVVFKNKVDFSCFPHLEEAYLDWSPKVKSIFDCKSLKKILMCKYKSKDRDLSPFNKLANLESLCFKICNIERIGDISNLKKLRELEIHWASKLTLLQGLGKLTGLKKLALDTCRRVNNINELAKLTNLEWLDISNNKEIESLKPIANLKRLRKLHFCDSTNILDGDLTVVKSLPNLLDVGFMERRHYNLGWKDMPGYEPPDREAARKTLIKQGFSPADADKIASSLK